MENNNQTIADIFANSYFRIPDYQRGYAWKKERQLPDMWEDILDIPLDQYGEYRPHYTGTLSLQKIQKEKLEPSEIKLLTDTGAKFYDIVDGQQRLTTLLILIFELSKKLKDKDLLRSFIHDTKKGSVYKFSYGSSNSNNHEYLVKEIFEDSNSLPAQKNVYTNNLKEAKEFFSEKLSNLSSKEARVIKTKILNALKFDIKYIDDNFDVQAVFETMNNRGKPLTILEKLKNRLLFLNSKLESSSSNLSNVINDSWKTIYEYLGKHENVMLDEDEFLSAFLTLIRIPADYSFSSQDAERKVFEMFCNRSKQYNLSYTRDQSDESKKEDPVSDDKIRRFVIDIANFVPFWYKVYFPDIEDELGKLIYQIQCMNGSKEIKLFLAELLKYEQKNRPGLLECLQNVKKILFRNRLPIPSIKDERTFATNARELHLKEIDLKSINTEFVKLLSVEINCSNLIDGFRWLFSYVRGNIGYHKWSGLKFFLFEYEEYTHQTKYSKDFPIIKWDLFYDTSIEHIMPRTYDTHWQASMDSYLSDKQLNDDEIKLAKNILLNSLGNLTIIRDKKNSSLGNNPWNVKLAAYANGCFSERNINDNKSWHPWSAESIYSRGKEMLEYLMSYLGCVVIDDGNKETYEQDLLFNSNKYVPVAKGLAAHTEQESAL